MEQKPSTSSMAAKKNSIRPKQATHPPVATMVNKAIEALDTKGGSSVRAIKKYMAANYLVEADKLMPFIKRYLAKAVETNVLIQATGKGLTGSYKLAAERKKAKTAKAVHVTALDAATRVEKKIDKKSSSKTTTTMPKSASSTKSKSSTSTKRKSDTSIKLKAVGKKASLFSPTTKSKSQFATPNKPQPVGKRASRDSIVLTQKRKMT